MTSQTTATRAERVIRGLLDEAGVGGPRPWPTAAALLDPVWRRLPFPFRSSFEVTEAGEVRLVRMARSYFGRELLPVYCFAVGDTLVDTGLSCAAEELEGFARDAGIRTVLLTHHHEDHSGNAARLAGAGARVLASTATAPLVERGFALRFYQHVLWGPAAPVRATPLAAPTIDLGRFEAQVVPAPGHCDDQVVYHVPSEGWLFSGDAFLHERVRVFRRDEDFARTVATLERLAGLDFDVLFCAHRPRRKGGREAIRAKLDWLRGIEGRVRELHGRGLPVEAITRGLALGPERPFFRLTFGDVSTANLVRSILHGPCPRPDVRAAPPAESSVGARA
jgi:glyoxylase-like metal-dependent hydrolase (beta-lactamase superfamily II)